LFKLSFCLFVLCIFWVQPQVKAQTVPVGMPFFEDALRRAQLMGRVDADVSFMVRPVDPSRAFGLQNAFGYDSVLFPTDTTKYSRYTDLLCYYKKDSSAAGLHFSTAYDTAGQETYRPKNNWQARLTLLPIYTHTRRTGHHPYGWNDGPMVPNKGLQQYISGGVHLRLGFFEAQYRPERVWAQNDSFQNPPFRARQIDNPDRMGQDTYVARFRGQSYVKAHLGPIAMGFSSENVWWGPGLKNAIILSNNAPGFGHFTIHTNRPIKGRYGTIEGQMVLGKLEYSGFFPYSRRYPPGTWPPIAANIVADTTLKTPFHSYVNAMQAVYQPIWLPGLFLGLSRVVQIAGETNDFANYFRILYLAPRGEQTFQGPDADGMNRNQLVAISARYLLPEAHAELYFEMGREDFWFDLEDLITRPSYSTVWLAGMRKIYKLSGRDRWFQVKGEYTKISAPFANYARPNIQANSFYTHSNGFGWTHRGQVLGAGIGPGSVMNTATFTYGKGFNTFGLTFERVSYNEDLFYNEIDYLRLGTVNPFFIDVSKQFVDWGLMLHHHTAYGHFFVGYQLHLRRTYNFQWNYDPFSLPGIFRFPGVNVWSLNADISCVYRF
jgi:hypothetical protein